MYMEKFKQLRERIGLSITQVAKILEIDRSQYGHYENNYITIPIKHLVKLCNYFEVSIDYIFGFTDTINYKNIQGINKIEAGKRLKQFRKENNLTQTKLSEYLNTSFSNVSSYERGINLLATNYLYAICNKYNISADYLIGRIDNPKYLK